MRAKSGLHMTNIAFVGFGELASSLAAGLARSGRHRLRAYIRAWPGASERYEGGLKAADTTPYGSLAEAMADAEVVLAAAPAMVSNQLAREAGAHLKPGALYAELATASGADKKAAAAALEPYRVLYADAAVLGTVASDGYRVPILVSGPGASALRSLLDPEGFNVTEIAGPVGQAALVKLLRSAYLKGRDALIVETLLAARRHGLQEVVVESLNRPGDRLPFNDIATRVLCSVAVHAGRRAHELEQSGEALREVGIDPALARAASQALDRIAQLGLSDVLGEGRPTDPAAVLAAIDELDASHH
jgi:3-hydroxyisobutyrate dehydrogenase-like beta-hydroxyacid dehydrogenase